MRARHELRNTYGFNNMFFFFSRRQSEHFDMTVMGRHAILNIKGATMADGGHWKLRLENKFGADEAVIKVGF